MPVRVNTAMWGGPRAGKTTLLAQMTAVVRFELERRLGLNMTGDFFTLERLNAAREELAALVGEVRAGGHGSKHGIFPTPPHQDVHRYSLGIANEDVTAGGMHFTDYAGERLKTLHTDPASEGILSEITAAQVLLVAVNTPPLMAALDFNDAEWWDLHERTNFNRTLAEMARQRSLAAKLIIFCPIKCERWISDNPDGTALRDAVIEGYKGAITEWQKQKRDMFVIPVLTVGGVEFDKFETDAPPGVPLNWTNAYDTYRASPNGSLSPRYNEEPLRHIMHAVLTSVTFGSIAEDLLGEVKNHFKRLEIKGVLSKGFKFILASWGDLYESSGLPSDEEIEDDFLAGTGLQEFRTAAEQLSSTRLTKPPVFRL